MKNWDLIVATLNWRGSANRILNAGQRADAWVAADGYGRMTLAQLNELELLEDWSHIRDSSDEGQERIAASIRDSLGSEKLRTVEQVVAKLGTTTEVAR